MSVNVTDYESSLQTQLDNTSGSTSATDMLLLAKAVDALDTGAVVTVATTGDLPAASDNTGRIIYVTGSSALYTSDGSQWSSLIATLVSLGITATAAELNYVDGVTSNIQTQLDAKLESVDISTYTGDVDITGELVVDSYNESYAAVTSTTNATTVDCEAGNTFMHTLTENTTFTFSNPPSSGTAYTMTVEIIQDSSASGYTVTWPTSVDWPSATAPTLTATASAVDVFVFTTRDGGTTWYGFTAGQAIA